MKHVHRLLGRIHGPLLLVLLFYLFAFERTLAYASDLQLPAILSGQTFPGEQVRAFPSSDNSLYFVAVSVRATNEQSVYSFFNESVWRRQVAPDKFMQKVQQDAKLQYAAVFCAMNADTFDLPCNNHAELYVIDRSRPWLIPVATVPADALSEALAVLAGTEVLADTEVVAKPERTPAAVEIPPPKPDVWRYRPNRDLFEIR